MLASRVEATLSAAGHEVRSSPSLQEAPLDEAELIVADLDAVEPGGAGRRSGSRCSATTRTSTPRRGEAAEAAGVDLVVPRSRNPSSKRFAS